MSLSFLKKLKQSKRHPLKQIFSQYNRAAIAQELGCNPQYFSNCLNGWATPGRALEAKIQALGSQILKAEQSEAKQTH